MITDLSRVGHLSGLPIEYKNLRHGGANSRPLKLVNYLISQIVSFFMFFKILLTHHEKPIIYINAIYPFAPALVARIFGCKVIWHIHEVSVPRILRVFLTRVVDLTATIAIFPSHFTANCYELKNVRKVVVPNEVDTKIKRAAALRSAWQIAPRRPFIVLMLASLKAYKGVYDFFELSKSFVDRPDIVFRLVANASKDEIATFKDECSGSNFEVLLGGGDVTLHLSEAAVVVNMSHPDKWVETFGLTLIEAFCFGIPVIAPNVGGPLDIVTHGEDGFLLHHQQKEVIASKIVDMASNHHYWQKLSDNARRKGARFSDGSMGEAVRKLTLHVQDRGL